MNTQLVNQKSALGQTQPSATLGTTNNNFGSKEKMGTSAVLNEDLFKITIRICNEKW
jgi:hypothetical protein